MKKTVLILSILSTMIGVYACKTGSEEPQRNFAIDNIMDRRSVREFTTEPISADTLDILVRAAMAAPTGLDKRPWEFIVLDNSADVYKFYEATGNDRFKTAPAAVIICGNTQESSLWYIDCACAAENLLLASHSMGLGSVFTAAFPVEERMKSISDFFSLPENIVPLCAIPVGHPLLDTHPKNKYTPNKIHTNKW